MFKYIKKIPESVNNFFKIHWFWYTIIIASPTVWFSIIVPYLGTYLGLQDEKGISVLGLIVSLVLFIPTGIVVFINNWYSSKTERGKLEQLQGEIEYLGIITENVDKICAEKYDQLRRTIVDVKKGSVESPKIVTKPSN